MTRMISPNFSWDEVITTLHREVDNSLPQDLVANAKVAAAGMERVRLALKCSPIIPSSWYRCPELNKLVGGSSTSDHMKARAVDFISPKFGSPIAIMKELVSGSKPKLVRWDQLIYEHTWVHISFCTDPTRSPKGQVLTWLGGSNYAQGITDKRGNPL